MFHSVIVRDKVTRQCPQTTSFFLRERRAEAVSNRGPSAYQPTALPLGQTGSLHSVVWFQVIYTGIAESLTSRLLLCPGAVARASSVRESRTRDNYTTLPPPPPQHTHTCTHTHTHTCTHTHTHTQPPSPPPPPPHT